MNSLIYLAIAALILLALIYVGVVLWRNLSHNGGGGRRGRRIGVVETHALDRERRLVLVRRDDVEHFLLIGGENDLLIEEGIPPEVDAGEEPVAFQRPSLEPAPRRAPPPPERIPEPEPFMEARAPVRPAPPPRPRAPMAAPRPARVAEDGEDA